jgi:DNA-binding MarR family transcriptional regulator
MASPGNPDPSLAPVVADLALAIGQLIRRLRSATPAGELNLSQASALSRLERDGPMTTADLARAEAMKPQSMKAVLESLEEADRVARQPHPTDGRQILFVPTAQGRGELQRRRATKQAWLVDALARFEPAEIAALSAAIPLIRRLADG